MSIQIIDNFNISVSKPIDDRFVVGPQSFYTDKNDIPYKYIGLRVWDLNDGVPYVWGGTNWTSENSVSVSGSGSASYVPKFLGSGNSTVLGNSCIYVSGNRVGINNTSITTGYNLDVIGGVISQGATGFSGVGTLLTNLNASNIFTGTMSLARLSNFSSIGWILTSGASQPSYTNPYSITVKAASASTVSNETTNSAIHYVSFVSGFSTADYRIKVNGVNSTESASTKQLTYKPSTGNLTSALMTTGTFSSTTSNSVTFNISSLSSTLANPAIKFSTYGAIYHTIAPTLGISLSGSDKLIVEFAHVNFGPQSTGTPRISLSASPTAALPSYTWYDDPNTGMYRSAADTIGFTTGGTQSMSISRNGISMIPPTNNNKWTVSSISVDCWVSNYSGGTTPLATPSAMSSTTYDRIIYANHAGDGVVHVELQAENWDDTWEMLNRSSPSGYSGTMMILPAGRRWRAFLDHEAGSGPTVAVTFIIYKLGK